MLEDIKKDAVTRMTKCVQTFQADTRKLRTGRAHPSLGRLEIRRTGERFAHEGVELRVAIAAPPAVARPCGLRSGEGLRGDVIRRRVRHRLRTEVRHRGAGTAKQQGQ